MAEVAVPVALAVLDKVLLFLHQKYHRQTKVKDDAEMARIRLRRMEACLADSSELLDEGTREFRTQVFEIQEWAYQIEDALDRYTLQVPHHIHSNTASQTMHKVRHYIPTRNAGKELSAEINGIIEKIKDCSIPLPVSQSPATASSGLNHHHHHVHEVEEIVGFEEHEEKLMAQLMDKNSKKLLTISIVGTGGSGKTTLAKKVFNEKRVQRFFGCQAWIHVPRACELDEILLNILSKIEAKGHKKPVSHGEDDHARLRRLLQKKRFLVVLDNVWSIEDLKGIVNALPDSSNGSRVIITTPKSDVARTLSSELYVHTLSGLPWKKAWLLFCKNVFQTSSGGSCPYELEELAQKILKRCEGLPLAISAVGTLLSTKAKTTVEWKNFHNSLGSEISRDLNLSFQPSYKDLPTHLKPCFLYFGIFPEDYSIRRQRLIRLWIAEGFVETRGGMTTEQVAEGYLNELVERNLVVTVSREIDGRVRNCRVLNLVRDFIISKAENFISVLDQTDCGTSGTPTEKIRRLSIHNVGTRFLKSGCNLNHTRTLCLFQQQISHSLLEKIVQNFQYLRVLDLQGVPLEDFPNSVLALTLLKYLSLRETNIKTVPKSIKDLALLETFDLKHTQVTTLPKEIYELHHLRHLLVYRYDVKNYVMFRDAQGVEVSQRKVSRRNIGELTKKKRRNIGDLSSIQKLSLIRVKNNSKLIKALGRLTGLRKLGLTDLERRDGKDLCLAIQKMEHLSTLDVRSSTQDEYLELDHMQSGSTPPIYLERLYLKGRLERLPQWIPKLQSLAKVGLKWSKLPLNANPLEFLQDLPNLMQLELVDYYTGEVLEFKTETFEKLKILHIEHFEGLKRVVIEREAMSVLKKLTICKCRKMKLLPVFGSDDLKSLEEMLLYDMHEEFIAKLQNACEDRLGYKHVRVIHSFSLGSNQSFTELKNLSPSQWQVEH